MSRSSHTRHWDAIVVGARCAGSATAMLLARAGLDVLVLESARAGTDTLSTHALMRAGVLQLHRWELLDDVIAAGTPAITSTDFGYGAAGAESIEIRAGAGVPALYAPRRAVLDTILADAAARDGAVVRHGCTVTDVLRGNDSRITGVQWIDRRTGQMSTATAPLVIGADGRNSTVARLVGSDVRHGGSSAGAILLSYFTGLDRHAYQWFYQRGATAGVVPTNDGLACVWAGLPAGRAGGFTAGRRPEDLYHGILAEAAPRLDLSGAERYGPIRGFRGAPGFVRRSSGPGWALVGDAGYFKDPITAHGITDALRDAELLATAIISSPGTGGRRLDALRDYETTRDELSAPLRLITERIASYDWDLSEIRDLLAALSAAMRPELAALLSMDEKVAA